VNHGRKTKTGSESSIVDGKLFFEDCQQCEVDSPTFSEMLEWHGQASIRVVSLSSDWFQRVFIGSDVVIRESINLEMTIRPENRSGKRHWYAYRRVFGKLYKRYVGVSESITQTRLVEVARRMPSK
jgi:hypothetical protein